jgi:dephospho-CoA kinase
LKKLVGLTGKTGAGKSTVSALLKEKGAYIIDGDVVARKVLVDNGSLLNKLSKEFGEDVLNPDGTLNRRALAKEAFSTPEKTERLNSIMHPAINGFIFEEAEKAFSDYDVVIVDAAAIIESGFTEKSDYLIVVHAPVEIRKERIIKRDGLTEADADIRINGQKDDEFYLSKADFIFNNFPPFDNKEQFLQLEKELFD